MTTVTMRPFGSNKVFVFRGVDTKRAERRADEMELLAKLRAILRRRTVSPLDGRRLTIEFETEAEARTCQIIIHQLSRRTRAEFERKPK